MISYAREDVVFVRTLQTAIQQHGLTAWVDTDALEPSAPVRQEIFDAIADASAVVLVLTPDWIESTYCRQEFDHALHLRKRLIPLLLRPVDESKVPPQLPDINWIRFDARPFDEAVRMVHRAYSLDLDRLRLHARLYRRAETWSPARDASILLRGNELIAAERWLSSSPPGEGEPTALHREFIVESRTHETLRQRRIRSIISVALAVTMALAATTFIFYRSSNARRKTAHSRLLASEALAREGSHLDVALLLASHAFQIDPTVESRGALLRTLMGHARLRRVLHGGRGGVEGVALSADEAFAAAGDSWGQLLLWRTDTGAVVDTSAATDRGDIVHAVAFSPTALRVVAAHMSGLVRVFGIEGNRLKLHASWKEEAPAYSLAYSNQGDRIAVGDLLGAVRVYDARVNGPPIRLLRPETAAPALALSFSPSGKLLAIGRGDEQVQIHRMDSDTPPIRVEQGSRPSTMTFAQSDDVLIVAGERLVRAWSLKSPNVPIAEATAADQVHAYVRSRSGRQLVALANGEIHVSRIPPSKGFEVLSGHGASVRSMDVRGDALITGAANGTVLLWSLSDESPLATSIGVHQSNPSQLVFDGSGEVLASADYSARMVIWSRRDHQVAIHELSDRLEDIGALTFSPDGKQLAIASDKSGILLWNTSKAQVDRTIGAELKDIYGLAFSRRPNQLVAVTSNGTTATVNVPTGVVRSFHPRTPTGRPMSFAVDAKRRRLAFGTNAGELVIVNLESGRYETAPLKVNADEVMGVAFLDDQRLVAVATGGALFEWDSGEGKRLREMTTGIDRPTSLAYSATTQILAIGDNDGNIQLLDGPTRQRIGPVIRGHQQPIQVLTFDRRGFTLASSSNDGAVTLWEIDPKRWAQLACALGNRALHEERDLFDLADAPPCVPTRLRHSWPTPKYPPGFVPIQPAPLKVHGGRIVGVP